MIELWTDGSAYNGSGGWAYIVVSNQERGGLGGFVDGQTNNSMEMMAVEKGLESLVIGTELVVVTDSLLVIGWLSKGWKCKYPHIQVIRDRIRAIIKQKELKVTFKHVRGKSCELARIVDEMAKRGRREAR